MKRRTMNPAGPFEAGACFKIVETEAVPFRAVGQNEFEKLKDRLLRHKLQQTDVPGLASALRRIANDTAAEAELTGFPELVFPELFEEKARAERERAMFQARLRIRSRAFLTFPLLQS